ncbi:hypothetical protein [Micromonospora endolithica]|uniref:Uncharacterized protein n=1 Tax=Micromonospora endolithica TaxID=230091 RepID=A0A3A9ZCM6_9ACTN|nr:hypothetical protein [Micromonospora endolithica]RKN46181.1 hypothetical protein D7223_14670 [Micromonospora endolithica]TWJ25110.1 hypothetical protein JD76_05273 [Micromonospora endolithica]
MKPERRAAAVTAALSAVEALADTQGWGAYPALLGLFDSTAHTRVGSLDVEELPIDPSVWQLHAMPGASLRVPYWVGLRAVAESLTTVKARELRAWTRAQLGPMVAMAFLGEGLDTSDAGRQAAAAHGLPADPGGIPVRAVTAHDIDGRVYQMLRMRGASTITTVTVDEPTPQMHPSVVAASLRRLLNAARA